MYLNTAPAAAARKPCLRDLHRLTTTLLIPAVVQLVSLDELERRCQEINLTNPEYQEETPLVMAYERKRRLRLSRWMHQSVSSFQVA